VCQQNSRDTLFRTPAELSQLTEHQQNSRHVDRKVYKMRELRVGGVVKLKLPPAKDMDADILTKAVDDATFARHRATIMRHPAIAKTETVYGKKSSGEATAEPKDRKVLPGYDGA